MQRVLETLDNSRGVFRPNGQPLYVVDGQHRIAALAKLVEEDPDNQARVAAIDIAELCAARDASARANRVVPRGPDWYRDALAHLRRSLPEVSAV